MKPQTMQQIIEGKRYNTEAATLLAGNDWWDGHNFERGGTQAFLYRTPKGRYFFQHLTQWEGQRDGLAPCTVDEAAAFWETADANGTTRATWEEAFPGIELEDA